MGAARWRDRDFETAPHIDCKVDVESQQEALTRPHPQARKIGAKLTQGSIKGQSIGIVRGPDDSKEPNCTHSLQTDWKKVLVPRAIIVVLDNGSPVLPIPWSGCCRSAKHHDPWRIDTAQGSASQGRISYSRKDVGFRLSLSDWYQCPC